MKERWGQGEHTIKEKENWIGGAPGNSKARIERGRNAKHRRRGFGLGGLLVGFFGFVFFFCFCCFLFVFCLFLSLFVWGCFDRATQLVGS